MVQLERVLVTSTNWTAWQAQKNGRGGEGRGKKQGREKKQGGSVLLSPQSPLPFPSSFDACHAGYCKPAN